MTSANCKLYVGGARAAGLSYYHS